MLLYRIRHKQTGKFFGGWIAPWSERYHGKCSWNDSGTFYRKIDTVAGHITCLCAEWEIKKKKVFGMWYTPKNFARFRKIKKLDRKKLKYYEVVVNDVKIKGEKIIKASDLLKDNK